MCISAGVNARTEEMFTMQEPASSFACSKNDMEHR